ncbi:MAG: heavy-metal-associated domain-containing protein [Planctomycetes bacterium]|nr:heavy-metal-associated domain-containing protein [Planctomycetota bacterium]
MSKKLIVGILGLSSALWVATLGAQVVAVQPAQTQSATVALAVTGLTSENASELLGLLAKAGCPCADSAMSEGTCCGTCGGDPSKCTAKSEKSAECCGTCGGDPAKCTAKSADAAESADAAKCSGACGGDPSKCTEKCSDAAKCKSACGSDTCAAQGEACGKVVSSVTADAQAGEVHFQVAPGRSLRLSQIQKALDKSAFRIDEKRLVLSGNTTLYVAGMTCGSCASDVQKRLGRLSPSAKATFVSMDESPVELASSGSNMPRYADALAAMSGTAFTIQDVAWTAPACSGTCGDSCQGACDKQAKGAEKSGCSGGCSGTR